MQDSFYLTVSSDFFSKDGFRVGTLHQIIKNEGSLDIIDTIIEKAPTSVTQQDKYGKNDIHTYL